MQKPGLTLAFVITFMVAATQSHAEIIDKGKFTTDTVTGLDWLDLTETKGMSYDDVSSQLTKGGKFEGWTYATREQINTLLVNAGFVKTLNAKKNNAALSKLLELWGITRFRDKKERGDESRFLYGLPFKTEIFKWNRQRAYIGSIVKTGKANKEGAVVLLNNIKFSLGTGESHDKTGSALVRASKK